MSGIAAQPAMPASTSAPSKSASSGIDDSLLSVFGVAELKELDPATHSAEAVAQRKKQIENQQAEAQSFADSLGWGDTKAAGQMLRGMKAMGLDPKLFQMVAEVAKYFQEQGVQGVGGELGDPQMNHTPPTQISNEIGPQRSTPEVIGGLA